MATVKHINIHNSDYGAAYEYLTMQHDEFTNKPILDENGLMMERDFYIIEGINCDPETFDLECEAVNALYKKNREYREVKAHHYIVSFDPNDRDENGLTPEKAQELGMELARKSFPGHQIIVCTHDDGHSGSGNIHCHIVLNSVRKINVPREDFMILPGDNKAGIKHHATDDFQKYFKSSVMELCQRESLYQVDLLSPARVRITDREYWAQRKGQAKLDAENATKKASGKLPTKTIYETDNAILRRQIKAVLEDSKNYDDFCQKLLGSYGILVGESRGRISYLPSNRAKPIRGRMLGTDFEKESIEKYLQDKLAIAQKAPVRAPELIMQLQYIVNEQARPYASQSAKIRSLKDMADSLAFCQENHIESQEELEALYKATQEDYLSKKDVHAKTVAELKDAKEILRYTKQRHANKKVYLEFMNARNKPKFRAKHESEIVLYEAATRELKKLLNGKPVPSEKTTAAKIRNLSARKNAEYEELSEIKRRERDLTEKVIRVRSIYERPAEHKKRIHELE